ncbi:hypothetical protein BLX24_29105 [Arsenicibacter rosenii]|uniref:Uncharacterized protein n=1 Tax=Arsenicibacter rosenii TaxID=1750698 RepID=A0A1S2VAD7_9BACT|nr:hypothetical protein BLX24_29105 [Arsenicibacter rosenii]
MRNGLQKQIMLYRSIILVYELIKARFFKSRAFFCSLQSIKLTACLFMYIDKKRPDKLNRAFLLLTTLGRLMTRIVTNDLTVLVQYQTEKFRLSLSYGQKINLNGNRMFNLHQ